MKFLVDAQLPYRLKSWLLAKNLNAIHTDDLPAKSLTGDREIARIADSESRVVITKDSDFLKLHILEKRPAKLLLITTGNIVNQQLLSLFEQNFKTILQLFEAYDVVELNNSFLIGHRFE
ncbi:MAG: DUF5615 family PIN-like protein [Blastocatellia bacterium]